MSALEQNVEPETVRTDWLAAVRHLEEDITRWAGEHGWSVSTEEKEIREKALGSYAVSLIEIDTHTGHHGRLIVEPIACSVPGARGMVDLFAWSSRNGVHLLRRDNGWIVRTDSGIDWPHPWSRDTFIEIATALVTTR